MPTTVPGPLPIDIISTLSPARDLDVIGLVSGITRDSIIAHRSRSLRSQELKLNDFSEADFHTATILTAPGADSSLKAAQSFHRPRSWICLRKTMSQETPKTFRKRLASVRVGNRVGVVTRRAHFDG